MKKSTILSGQQGSGKSWIAKAIKNQYKKINIYSTTAAKFKICLEKNPIPVDSKTKLLIVEECTFGDIILIDEYIRQFNIRNLSIVYITQEIVNSKHPNFHVIETNFLPF